MQRPSFQKESVILLQKSFEGVPVLIFGTGSNIGYSITPSGANPINYILDEIYSLVL